MKSLSLAKKSFRSSNCSIKLISLQWRHDDRVTGLCEWIHWCPVNSPHKGPVTQKNFHLMTSSYQMWCWCWHVVNWTHGNILQGKLNQSIDTTLFIHEKSLWKYRLQNGGLIVPAALSHYFCWTANTAKLRMMFFLSDSHLFVLEGKPKYLPTDYVKS